MNGTRVDAPSRPVRPGDVITIALDRRVRVLKVLGYAERRGSATDAKPLYEDLSPPVAAPAEQRSSAREQGSGRPTKRDRRAITRLLGREQLDFD